MKRTEQRRFDICGLKPRWIIEKVSRMQYSAKNSCVTSLKDAQDCAPKITNVLIGTTYIDFCYFFCFKATYVAIFEGRTKLQLDYSIKTKF
jgi:hypothetical protein